jgi:hypothetical protein
LSREKREQVIALGRLGWSLRRIEQATGVRRAMGRAISLDQRPVAAQLAGRDSVLPVPAGDTENRLYNAIESLNMSLRKAIKTRGAFPSEDAALKVMYLALRNLARKWNAVQGWKEALNRFALVWEARFPHQCA